MGDAERRMSGMIYRVRWSPSDRAFIAYSANCPGLTGTATSPYEAMNALEAKIRAASASDATDPARTDTITHRATATPAPETPGRR